MDAAPSRTLEAEVARLHQTVAELDRRQRASEELARIARLVNETLDLTTVSERIADSVLGMLSVHSSAIRLIQPDGSLKAIALGGRAREHAANRDVVPRGTGLIGWAALEGRPGWTEDFRTDPRFRTSPEIRARNAALDIVAGLAVPLRLSGKVIGVLSVGNRRPGRSPRPRSSCSRALPIRSPSPSGTRRRKRRSPSRPSA